MVLGCGLVRERNCAGPFRDAMHVVDGRSGHDAFSLALRACFHLLLTVCTCLRRDTLLEMRCPLPVVLIFCFAETAPPRAVRQGLTYETYLQSDVDGASLGKPSLQSRPLPPNSPPHRPSDYLILSFPSC